MLRTAREIASLGQEVRTARLMHGLTQRHVGRAAGISGQYAGRVERGQVQRVAPVVLSRMLAAVGLELSMRAFPSGTPIRDAGHATLLERVRARLGPGWRWQLEVPVVGGADPRAWDALATRPGARLAFEAETRLYDVQAQVRHVIGKFAAGEVDRLVLVVADTRHNRRVLREIRELLRADFPLDTRTVMAALDAGHDPGANGIALL